MPKLIQAAEFFVVGGPVQPDRPCYVERPADQVLEIALRSQRCCCVLEPRGSGKSSLMGRVARSLRQRGGLAAVVDLGQIGARGDDAEADRWAYSIAHRVVHELRLTFDLREWWDEQGTVMSEERLADFFWEVVLTNTTTDVAVFVDEIEQALRLPFGTDLLKAIDACYARRAAEPDYARLNFVVLGAVPLAGLAVDAASVFANAAVIDLPDFAPDDAYQLAIGFGGEPAHAQALMDRILAWTSGHPYLTQKIARGVARKAGRLEDVENIVKEQLLAPAAAQREPLIGQMRLALTGGGTLARQALKLLKAVARGRRPSAPAQSAPLEVLRLSGVVTVADGRIEYRNRIFKVLFGRRWIRSALPMGWVGWAAAAALVAAAALGGYYWYAQYVPQPYVRTLTSPTTTFSSATAAYEKLRALPGFAEEANRLYVAALTREGAAAGSLEAFAPVAGALRTLPGGAEIAQRLESALWLKRSTEAANAEQRDAAILLAQRAAAAGAASARPMLDSLVGDDYSLLTQTATVAPAPDTWAVDFARSRLVLLDEGRRVSVRPLSASDAVAAAPVALTALKHEPLVREVTVDDSGSAGAFELALSLTHPAGREVLVTLTAPSGTQANLVLPAQGDDEGRYVFTAAGASPLATLADEERRGVWQLTLVDRRADNVGALLGWHLKFGDDTWADEPGGPVPIPDPTRTEQVSVALDEAGTHAIVAPLQPGKIGAVALWDLADAKLQADFTLPAPARYVAVNSTATRLAAASGDVLTLWNAVDALPVARLATQTEFVLPPAFSSDGDYFVMAERVETAPLVSLLRADDGSLLTSFEGMEGVQAWYLGPGARYLVLQLSTRVLRVVDPRRGTELAELRHGRDVERVVLMARGAVVLTVDSAGVIRAWDIATARAGVVAPRTLGVTVDAKSMSVAADGSRLAYTSADGTVDIVALPGGDEVRSLRLPSAQDVARSRLSPDGRELITGSGAFFRRWRLPPSTDTPSAAALRPVNATALALAPRTARTIVGLRSGQIRVASSTGAPESPPAALEYFGHVGAIESIAVTADESSMVTGADDGAVREWNLATAAPAGLPMQPAASASPTLVRAVAISGDGRWAAAAAGAAVRVWQVDDRVLTADIAVADGATAVAFTADDRHLVIGDAKGLLRVAELGGAVTAAPKPLGASIRSLDVAPSDDVVASGDDAGHVQLWRIDNAAAVGRAATLPAPVRWVGFSPDGATLYVATDAWLHRYGVGPAGLEAIDARLPAVRPATAAFTPLTAERIRIAGFDGAGALAVRELDFSTPPADAEGGSGVAQRDWSTVLGLRIDEAGNVVSIAR